MTMIKDAISEFMAHKYGKPCETKQDMSRIAVKCQHDCDKDKGVKCWQRILSVSEDDKNGQDNT